MKLIERKKELDEQQIYNWDNLKFQKYLLEIIKTKRISFTIGRGDILDGRFPKGDFPVFSRDFLFFLKNFCSHHVLPLPICFLFLRFTRLFELDLILLYTLNIIKLFIITLSASCSVQKECFCCCRKIGKLILIKLLIQSKI